MNLFWAFFVGISASVMGYHGFELIMIFFGTYFVITLGDINRKLSRK